MNTTGDADFVDADEVNDTRTHNAVNELTARDTDSDSTNNYSLAFDAAGNQTDDGKDYEYVWDAFYRLRKVNRTDNQALVAEYRYNGLGFKIAEHADTDTDGDVDGNDKWYYDAFDERWRQVSRFRESDTSPKEEFVAHQAGASGGGDSSYIDLVLCRYKDANTAWTSASDGTLEERLYYCQNQHADVVALVGSDGTQKEQVRYSAYGVPFGLPGGDCDSDGDCDSADVTQVQAWIDAPAYDVRGDVDLDGDVDALDKSSTIAAFEGITVGRLSLTSPHVMNSRSNAGGGSYHPETLLLLYRKRFINATQGQWTQRDPAGFVDGVGLYLFNKSSPHRYSDPSGRYAEGSTLCYATPPTVPNSGGTATLPTVVGPPTWTLGPPKDDWAIAANSTDLASMHRTFGDCVIPLECAWSGGVRLRLVMKDDQGNWGGVSSDSQEYRDWHCPDCLQREPTAPIWSAETGGSGGGGSQSTPPPPTTSAGTATINETAPCGSVATLTFHATPAFPDRLPTLSITFEFFCEPCSRFGWRRHVAYSADNYSNGVSLAND